MLGSVRRWLLYSARPPLLAGPSDLNAVVSLAAMDSEKELGQVKVVDATENILVEVADSDELELAAMGKKQVLWVRLVAFLFDRKATLT